jgi:archaemetzincin
MKIGVIPIGQVEEAVLLRINGGVTRVFPNTTGTVVNEKMVFRETAFDEKRKQYRSHTILGDVQGYALKNPDLDCVLGVVDADIFVPQLNFVFGEAIYPGRAALISLWRLRPKFYGEVPDIKLFYDRAVKEAVHELGHTLGLRHCSRAQCVMHFSKSISDTDVKQRSFCDKCYLHVKTSIERLG